MVLDLSKEVQTGFNDTDRQYDLNILVHELIEQQACLTPKKVALVFNGKEMTYEELNGRANCLARTLRDIGVIRDQIIGVMVNRSMDMMVALLAVLKAGAAYLPIDPELPSKRIKFMIEDSGVSILLTSGTDINKTIENQKLLDVSDSKNYHCDSTNLHRINESYDLAYIQYTSGSTGTPKGVLIEHKSVTNFIFSLLENVDFNDQKSILSVTTISFDIFVLETLLPLVKGMKIILTDEKEQVNPKKIIDLIEKYQIDMLQMTPSRLNLLLSYKREATFLKNVKELMIGGETFPASLYEKLKKCTKGKIYNLYGPTETTIWSCIKKLTGDDSITIGKPIANTKVVVVNDNNEILNVGCEGELCISGTGLSRGYHNRPELNEEKYKLINGKRCYKTGDMARWLSSGELEYLGRRDFQIKIRGFRIEPGEIELEISKKPEIKETVIVKRIHNGNDSILCAFFSTYNNIQIDTNEIRSNLSEALPDYMVPGLFIQLPDIPKTSNGKIDRKFLIEYNQTQTHTITSDEQVCVNNNVEEVINSIIVSYLDGLYKDVKLDVNEAFTDYGINSITFIKILVDIETKLNIEFEDEDLDFSKFETIKSLVDYLQQITIEK